MQERKTDRQVCIQSVCLCRFNGSLFGRGPTVNTYRWLSSQMLLLNEALCSLVSHTDMHTQIQTCVLTNTDRQLHSRGHKLLRGTAVYMQTHTHTHTVRWHCPPLRRAELLAHHWNFFKEALKAIWSSNDTVFLCPCLSVCSFTLSHHFFLSCSVSAIFWHDIETRFTLATAVLKGMNWLTNSGLNDDQVIIPKNEIGSFVYKCFSLAVTLFFSPLSGTMLHWIDIIHVHFSKALLLVRNLTW